METGECLYNNEHTGTRRKVSLKIGSQKVNGILPPDEEELQPLQEESRAGEICNGSPVGSSNYEVREFVEQYTMEELQGLASGSRFLNHELWRAEMAMTIEGKELFCCSYLFLHQSCPSKCDLGWWSHHFSFVSVASPTYLKGLCTLCYSLYHDIGIISPKMLYIWRKGLLVQYTTGDKCHKSLNSH
ncbi:hypothetical protein NE237_004363 [Protea cynaroides]|uniref:Uncharacterized protein n=1 Tax=Protea cynaroides TaxID=273540 RepID=A0A9Q0QTM0_9MAGN|nr:hypothetical protein NE237_004363 [Protea cynaroides]